MNLEAEGTAPISAEGELALSPLTTLIENAEREFDAGHADQAIQSLEDARRGYHESRDARSEGAVLRSLANMEFARDHAREAERYLELACERYNSAQERVTASDLYLSLGDVRSKIGAPKTAREAYLAAAKISRGLDDAQNQAHAEFKLGNLHAKTNYDMALRHYTFAASLYERANSRLPDEEGLRLNNPHLPEHVEDCRLYEPRVMLRVAQREAERLRAEIGTAAAEKTETSVAQPTAGDTMRGLVGFVLMPAVFIGAVYALVNLPAYPYTMSQTLLGILSIIAGTLSGVMARMNGVTSRAVQWGGGLAVCAAVQIANLALTRNHAIPVADNSSALALAEGLAQLAVAEEAEADPSVKKAELIRVVQVARQKGDRPGEAAALQAQADFQLKSGPTPEITTLYDQAFDIFHELNDSPKQIEVLMSLGSVHRSLNHHAQAREAYTKAATLHQQRKEPVEQAKVLLQVGDLETNLKRPKEARTAYARAIELAHTRDPIAEAEALLRLGKLDASQKATDLARKSYQQALALSEERKDLQGQGAALRHLGELEADAKKYQEASTFYERALALYRTDPQNVTGEVQTLKLLGDLERKRKRPEAARDYYAKALALAEDKDAGKHSAALLIALADTAAAMGARDQARDYYMRALGRHEQARNVDGQILTLRRLSQLTAKDNVPLAQEYAKRAAELQGTADKAAL